ncbi:MAG: hypothetical protein KAG56_00100 [Sulfurovaceae bacterium]|nr:hypothetical protein [Sulfurovaceae bacterium]
MKKIKIGIKFTQKLTYEQFESFQYLLQYDFEYEDIETYIEEQKIIELDIDDEEDRADDLEVLQAILEEFDRDEVMYELYEFDEKWEKRELAQLK